MLNVCGKPLGLHGRLGTTGIGPFDESLFCQFRWARGGCRLLPQLRSPTAQVGEPWRGRACPADLPPGRVSAFLLQLVPERQLEDIKFAVAQLPDVRVVEGNTVLTSSRQALSFAADRHRRIYGGSAAALLIVVSLLFSAILRERYREIGLLRAMGARPSPATFRSRGSAHGGSPKTIVTPQSSTRPAGWPQTWRCRSAANSAPVAK